MASIWNISILLLLVLGTANAKSNTNQQAKKPIQTFRPYNLAHRGASGEIPEETTAAYVVEYFLNLFYPSLPEWGQLRAIEIGADFIEADIIASKDGQLVCFHDVTLDDTTDIKNRTEFSDRKRTYEVERVNVTGYFVVDFTLEELKSLKVNQRYIFRDQQFNGKYSIITFEEYIIIALYADRTVGIYPEIKNPVHINEHVKWSNGKKFEDIFVETLQKYGYKGTYLSESWLKQPIFIQCFAPTSLIYLSNKTDSPKVFLIDDVSVTTQDTNQSYAEITSDAYLSYISQYVIGIGPWKDTVVPPINNYLTPPTDLVVRAHALNLQVHPYTFRNENKYLHFDFHQDPYQEFDYWINQIGVDGLFTDFTGSFYLYQEHTSPCPKDSKTSEDLLLKIEKMKSQYDHA